MIKRNLKDPDAKEIWDNVERVAAQCPKWMKPRIKKLAKEAVDALSKDSREVLKEILLTTNKGFIYKGGGSIPGYGIDPEYISKEKDEIHQPLGKNNRELVYEKENSKGLCKIYFYWYKQTDPLTASYPFYHKVFEVEYKLKHTQINLSGIKSFDQKQPAIDWCDNFLNLQKDIIISNRFPLPSINFI